MLDWPMTSQESLNDHAWDRRNIAVGAAEQISILWFSLLRTIHHPQ
jgi:hypothetical protein